MALPIEWKGSDLFTHMLVVGATRSGKTATILKPIIYQLLLAKKRGVPLGISVVEPKGDVAQMLADMAYEMDLDCTHIDPMQPEISGHFNPMEGEINDVAEATVIVLKGLFGKQDAFFATVQELSARNVVKLLKELHGDNMDIMDVLVALRDPVILKQKVAELEQKQGNTDLVDFFKSELLGSMADKYRQFVIGLRAQLENIVSNDSLRKIITNKSSIDMDQHFEKGGLLAVNTALGKLRSSGDAFGQFITMHLQNATFRRPPTEDDSVVPHFMIVDEYSRYINPDVEIFLSLAATYKVAGIFAIQSLSQLEIESGKYSAQAMRQSILNNTRNKIVFGGVAMDDARAFSDMFGEDEIVMRQSTYKNRIVLPNLFPDSYRDTETEESRFSATDIMDQLPRFTYVHQLMKNGKLEEPGLGLGGFVPRDWKERREWEQGSTIKNINPIKKIKSLFNNKENEENKEETFFDLSEEEQKQLDYEADYEEELFIESETSAQQNYTEMGSRYKRELEKEGITEDTLKLTEVEIQEVQMSGKDTRISESDFNDTSKLNEELPLTDETDPPEPPLTIEAMSKEATMKNKPLQEETLEEDTTSLDDLFPMGNEEVEPEPVQEKVQPIKEPSEPVQEERKEETTKESSEPSKVAVKASPIDDDDDFWD